MGILKDNAIRKWTPVLNNMGITNESLLVSVSIFCELVSNSQKNQNSLPKMLLEVKKKLYTYFRVKIKSEIYNLVSCEKEYELDNGMIVDCTIRNKVELTEEQFLELFGDYAIEVMKEMDIKKFRNNRINNILDGSKS